MTNPVEAILKIQRSGTSPAGGHCLLCGTTSPTIYRCDATCESTQLKRGGGPEANDIPHLLAYIFLGGWIGSLLSSGTTKKAEVHGHDLGVTFELPVCDVCVATNGKPTNIRVAKDLMRRVPEYRNLLASYPELTLLVTRRSA